jgi:hypothetical protein
MVDFVDEQMARRETVRKLRIARRYVADSLPYLYTEAPGYAGEVEAVKEAIENAIKVLSGEAPE